MLIWMLVALLIFMFMFFFYNSLKKPYYIMTPVMHVTTGSSPSTPDICKRPKCFIRTYPKEEKVIFREFTGSSTPRYLFEENRNSNLKFYFNKQPSLPNGAYIEVILESWAEDFEILQHHNGYIQWLFPLPRSSKTNIYAQPLTEEERSIISTEPILRRRVLQAFKVMLTFYGIEMVGPHHFGHFPNFRERFDNFQRYPNNFKRITRMVESLRYLDFQVQAVFFVKFLADMVRFQLLPKAEESINDYWIPQLSRREQFQLQNLLDN
ncbi:opioid growth factor receptor-like protein 1 [Octopus bimaculoides]|uniref:Opioid growth factor receptor (OGFr) conserved domain-containing protein n=1 Tax=Octopus bimaculoides TaxID=37653 RepID=A0A0L8HQG4_OCTBM|nr:opioid growth factor receptor-like protein 1 [Octopus bimaculoides]|eukprot:XP_014770405.1 PREDICTED: opioid growth factor receptor-like protein 1 isoform X2 [Octopus bimaculoides]